MPHQVYGSPISYFTGKLEGYLRYKEIPYERLSMSPRRQIQVRRGTGVGQVPAVKLEDGRWMTDTTPIIEWFETQHPEPAVIPSDPVQAFASRLVEDYADEWLWRPALYYRWHFRGDAALLSRQIVEEWFAGIPLPGALKRLALRARQRRVYTSGDGVSRQNRAAVEAIYRAQLEALEAIFAQRPFLLGERPTLGDFGFFASMFRHFANDPTPAALMREEAPSVYAWVARLWAARARRDAGSLEPGVPGDWAPILAQIAGAYLPMLVANAGAWHERAPRFDAELAGVAYTGMRTSRYRVWCLERLRGHYEALAPEAQPLVREWLEAYSCWEPLFATPHVKSGLDPEGNAPFAPGQRMLGV